MTSWRNAELVQCPVCGRRRRVLEDDARNPRICGYFCAGWPPEQHDLTWMVALPAKDGEPAA